MKKEFIFGYHAVLVLLQNSPQNIQQIYLRQGRKDVRVQNILQLVHANDLQVKVLPRQKMDVLVNGAKHQGIIAIVKKEKYHKAAQHFTGDLEVFLDQLPKSALFLILDEVQDPHNLGACLRTANAAGVDAVIVPKDNAVGITSVVRKVACGAAENVNFFQVVNLSRTLEKLKQRGVWIYGAEVRASQNIYQTDLTDSIAIVLGAEGRGLRRLTKEKCDYLIKIPMPGSIASLNVSVAAGICLFEVVRRRLMSNHS